MKSKLRNIIVNQLIMIAADNLSKKSIYWQTITSMSFYLLPNACVALIFAAMKIVVNTRDIFKNAAENDNLFVYESFKKIAASHSNDEFIFITDKPLDVELSSLKNITQLVIETEIKKSLLWQLWYKYKLPALVKKYKADILVNANGICSWRTKIPQCVLVQNLSFLQHPQFTEKKQLRFYKKFIPASLNKAKTIVIVSQAAKETIIEKYKIDDTKINVVHVGINKLFKPIDWKEKESIKEKYAEGKEFFLFAGSADAINNLITLLKAFSFFKKRQKSNMQLLIDVTPSSQLKKFRENLQTYKYRNEVKLLENLHEEELAKITAAAYSFISASLSESTIPTVLMVMKCAAPVIVPDLPVFREICADAALYANPDSFEDMADKAMLIFKDENIRDELIKKGKQQMLLYDWDKTADLLWDTIAKTVQQ
jgi:glycosyltransferase involved in cell wall biosynthesis